AGVTGRTADGGASLIIGASNAGDTGPWAAGGGSNDAGTSGTGVGSGAGAASGMALQAGEVGFTSSCIGRSRIPPPVLYSCPRLALRLVPALSAMGFLVGDSRVYAFYGGA